MAYYEYSDVDLGGNREETLNLVRKAYIKSGYVSPESTENSFAKYILSEQTKVLKGTCNGHTVATISVVLDSPLGLPMDGLYSQELNPMRESGKKIAEVSQFAVDTDLIKEIDKEFSLAKHLDISQNLFSLVLKYAQEMKLDNLCIAVAPKHMRFYQSVGFQKISFGEKYYPEVNCPSYALSLDLRKSIHARII